MRQAIDLERLDHAVFTAGVDGDAGDLLDVQRVVAHYLEVLRDAGEDAFAGVADVGDEAVARLRRAGDARAG